MVLPVGPDSESERPTQSDTIISLPFPNKGIVPAPTVIGDSKGSCPTIGVSVRPSKLAPNTIIVRTELDPIQTKYA